VPVGAVTGIAQMARYLADEQSGLPLILRGSMRLMLEEIRLLEARIAQLETQLTAIAKHSPACQMLLTVPGIGLITSTAMVAAVGNPASFASGRRYASFLGLTPREFSSGNSRYLGRISKRGDRYIRTLLTHGARSVLRAATVASRAGREIDRLRSWALAVQGRTNHNKAACALANKLARIAWAVWVKHETYRAQAMPAAQSPLCNV
jgi:transposase